MRSRKVQNQEFKKLPKDWLMDITELLNSTYKSECDKQEKSFLVLGHTFPDEVVLFVSFLDEKDLGAMPITLILSSDLDSKKRPEKLLNALVEFIGIFFDQVFSLKDWDEYNTNWSMEEIKSFEIHYITTRENILLTMKADELLNE